MNRKHLGILLPASALFLAAGEMWLHAAELGAVVPEADYANAAMRVESEIEVRDGIAFSPHWTAPIGRKTFAKVLTAERSEPSDFDRFERVWEVQTHGAKSRGVEGFREIKRLRVGKLDVRLLENPKKTALSDDLLSHVHDRGLAVSIRAGGVETPCPWASGAPSADTWSPAVPAARFACPNGPVGIIYTPSGEFRSRRCLYAAPPGGAGALRLRFMNVKYSKWLFGHHTVHVFSDKPGSGTPITVSFRVLAEGPSEEVLETELGRLTHRDGDGWKPFSVLTDSLEGQTGDLIADISSPSAEKRLFCFEATTRSEVP